MNGGLEVRIRHLLHAHEAGLITAEECQEECAILRQRAQQLRWSSSRTPRQLHSNCTPIPIGEAVAKMVELAETRRHGEQALDAA